MQSLITNIPLDETIENCINDLFSNDTFHIKDLKELIQIASYESLFTFANIIDN